MQPQDRDGQNEDDPDDGKPNQGAFPEVPGRLGDVRSRQPSHGMGDQVEVPETHRAPHAESQRPVPSTQQQQDRHPGRAHDRSTCQGPTDKGFSLVQDGNGKGDVAKSRPQEGAEITAESRKKSGSS